MHNFAHKMVWSAVLKIAAFATAKHKINLTLSNPIC